MSDTILSGRWVITYEAENREKSIRRDTATSPTTTDSVNALYSALQNHFDELNNMDDGTPMSAQTPTEYTIGLIDAGSDDPWFIDRESTEYLTGGALQTSSWTRATGTNTGIVKFDYTVGAGTDLAASDIGLTITSAATSDSGTLLDFVTDGSNGTMFIRPADETATHDWDGTPTDVSVTGGTGLNLDQDAAAVTGESLWANIFTLGTIEDNTHMYVEQPAGTLLTAYQGTTDWWGDGQIDILVNVKEADVETDVGALVVFARQYSKGYSFFETDVTAGGRNPIPLQTGDDLDNTSGVLQQVSTTASADFTVDEVIEDDTDSTIQGVVTSNTGTAPNLTIQYYLIGDPLTDFSAGTGQFTGAESSSTSTAVNSTAVGPAALAGLSITHSANETFDIDEDGTTENYSIVIDVSDETLADAYEWSKYITRRGSTNT
ncbi:MAG: hypothetical protein ACXABY_24470, partial [Candidatus Thorarchaeota archaeon]